MGFQIRIKEDGVENVYPLYCHASDFTPGVICEDNDSKITLNFTKGGSQQLDFLETTTPDKQYAFFELLNKRISFDLNVSCVKKSFNFAFYTSALTRGDTYKDAQSGDSRTEIDLTEANRGAYHFTAHKAYDRGGNLIMGTGGTVQMYNPNSRFLCEDASQSRDSLYGPGMYIDTCAVVHVEIVFTSENVRMELSQGNRKIYQENNSDDVRSLIGELQGKRHTPIISLWTGSMWWLDDNLPFYDEGGIPEVNASIANICFDNITYSPSEIPDCPATDGSSPQMATCPYCGKTFLLAHSII